MKIVVPISVGELLDKISILSIKAQYTKNDFVTKELNTLIKIAQDSNVYDTKYLPQLLTINRKLWVVEDKIREREKYQSFNEDFIELARSVYKLNDTRSQIKKEINEFYKSEMQEVKVYN